MKKVFYSLLLLAGASMGFVACNNGDYTANPNSVVTTGINPLSPLTAADFTWSGTTPLSALVNGSSFVADSATTTWTHDTVGGIFITGLKGSQGFTFYLKNTYNNNLYSMSYGNINMYGAYIDSLGSPTSYYSSYLGNSGEVYIIENDSAYITGKFYFTGVTAYGAAISITNGYFKIIKN